MVHSNGSPEVSVALCTHNGARYIAMQMRSILEQTIPVSEIVISDDASTDDTVAIAEAVVAASPAPRPHLHVIRNGSVLGVTANFQQVALACRGELIALCDQDDAWRPDKLETIVPIFVERPDVLLVHSDAFLIDEDGARMPRSLFSSLEARAAELREIHSGRAFRTFLRRNLVTGATTVFRARLLERAVPFPAEWVHDEWLAITAAATGTVDVVEDELIEYRQHGANQIGVRKLSFREKVARLWEPRSDRNRKMVARAEALCARFGQLGIDSAIMGLANGKLAHERFRSSLPASRPARVFPVAVAWAAGRYGRFSRGRIDVARDLFQSAD